MLGFGGAVVAAQAADAVSPYSAPVAPAASEPAVAKSNLDVLFAGIFLNGGGYSNFKIGAAGAKVAIPLGHSYGLQVDAAVGTQSYWGVGGHLFWRDPSEGLIGAFASHESLQGVTLDRYGAEALRLDLRNITLSGEVGAQSGGAPHSPFAGLDVTFYTNPNFSVTAGAEFRESQLVGHAGFELQPNVGHMAGMSVFADAEWGQSNYSKVVAGVTFHFGSAGVTLEDRDRKYDPKFGLFNFSLAQNASYGAF